MIVLLFTSMDPAEALEAAESALREAVRLALPDWERMPGAPNLDELRRRKAAEAKRRDGTLVEADNLAYTELHQLETLIIKNWEKFSPMFGDLARTKVYLAALLDYRNAVAHSRELAAFERNLLAGVSGQIRNQVVLHRTIREPSSAHYPVIESVTDGFGQVFHASEYMALNAPQKIRLNVGDSVEFHCRAWDSQSRRLAWSVAVMKGLIMKTAPPSLELPGNPLRFAVLVSDRFIAEDVFVRIAVRTDDSHHRHQPSGLPSASIHRRSIRG